MKCYLFDENGKYTGEYNAQESPLEPGAFIFPEKSTLINPPSFLNNEFAVFDGIAWRIETEPPPPISPQPTIEELRAQMILTPAQARIKLANLGMLSSIEAMIATLPIANLTRIYWYYATEFRRDDEILTTFCAENLGLNPEQIDALFE